MRDTGMGGSLLPLYAAQVADGADGYDDFVALFRRSLQVASGEDVWLLDPTGIGPDGEWAAYLFSPKCDDLDSCTSFAGLFHGSREFLE
ncbi:hypothetical protein NKH18_46330 [Streptomyces sp. M10(2022)]